MRTKIQSALAILCLFVYAPIANVNIGDAFANQGNPPNAAAQNTEEKLPSPVLKLIPKGKKEQLPTYKENLVSPNPEVREEAAQSLSTMGSGATKAVPDLVNALKKPDVPKVHAAVAHALGTIGSKDQAVIDELLKLLGPKTEASVSREAAMALGKIKSHAKTVVPELIKALKVKRGRYIHRGAATALGNYGSDAVDAMPVLINYVKTESNLDRQIAAKAVESIANGLFDTADIDSVPMLINSRKALDSIMESSMVPYDEDAVRKASNAVDRTIKYLKSHTPDDTKWQKVVSLISHIHKQYPYILPLVSAYLVWIFFWLAAFWVKPRSLLRVNTFLQPYDFKLPSRIGGMTVPLRLLLIVGFLSNRIRVLDSWVNARIEGYRTAFAAKPTVRDRSIHILNPIRLDQVMCELSVESLRPTFEEKSNRLLIWGEGGSGKTSMACQIARWAMADAATSRLCKHLMLPVIIEHELESTESSNGLFKAIAGQLEDLTNLKESIPDELIFRLLKNQRIMVIVDHLSEMSEITRSQILPEKRNFPARALIITSRVKEKLGGVSKTSIQPLRIQGNRLSSFMDAYLAQRCKRDIFTDTEFFNACSRLSAMVGSREITVLLAKLYAEQMIAAKERSSDATLPETIPDLMLQYLNEVNSSVTQNKIEDRTLHKAMMCLAWKCLKQSFRPASARYDTAIETFNCVDPMICKYIEEQLHLIETISPAKNHFRFALDPLAEYLAGLYLIYTCGQDTVKWSAFLTEAKNKEGTHGTIRGFILAVRDCCLARAAEVKIPPYVLGELEKLADVKQQTSTDRVASENEKLDGYQIISR